jgi:hypothetical protein
MEHSPSSYAVGSPRSNEIPRNLETLKVHNRERKSLAVILSLRSFRATIVAVEKR